MDKYRHIDTTGLPPGFDIADLVESGITGQKLIDWCKERVRPGPPSLTQEEMQPVKAVKPTAARPKSVGVSRPPPATNVVPLPAPEPEPMVDIPPEFSQDSLAEEFTRQNKDTLAYCGLLGKWLHWENNLWVVDDTALAVDLARRVCREAAIMALDRADLGSKANSIANSISSRNCFAAVEGIARSDRRHVVRPSQFDAEPWHLNTPGGIVDLHTGRIRQAKRGDWCTKQTKVAPGGECPIWLRFLQDCTAGDADMQAYLQQIAGYCLTGSISEQKFFFIYGVGGNGKGTYLNMLMWILDAYARMANMDTFTEQKFTKHASEIAFFQGSRLVVASETNAGQRWNESRIKSMTGGDPITANHMHHDPFTFFPTFKLLFTGNHKPHLKHVDAAIKRRMYLIPFEHQVPDESIDLQLADKLQAEGGGILQWAIEGCLDWQKHGLSPPAKVIATTASYFEEEDRIASFFEECCDLGNSYQCATADLYARFSTWADDMGEFVGSRKTFLDMLAVKGYKSVRVGGEQTLYGIRVAFGALPLPNRNGQYND